MWHDQIMSPVSRRERHTFFEGAWSSLLTVLMTWLNQLTAKATRSIMGYQSAKTVLNWPVCPTCHHHQHLETIVSPLLPTTTWDEAIETIQGGERSLPTKTYEASLLRLDISGFTALMDEQPLDQVLAALDAYFKWLTPVVYHHHGDIYKFLGDGFLALFESSDEAVAAGVAIQQAAAEFNHRQSTTGGLIFPTRLAIDTGPVALTTLGSPKRRDRTVMGMPVNLAERLQALATPGRVWLTQATFERLSDPSACCCLGPVEIRGKQASVIVYEVTNK